MLGQARQPTPTEGGPADVASHMATALKEAAKAAEVKPADLLGVGVGSPGDVDEEKGTVGNARNLPGWTGTFELAATLSEQFGTKVHVGNDVQVATQAEFEFGAGRPYSSVLGVMWGTGVGGGLILDGKPWLGRGGAGRDRAHGRQARRRAVPVRAQGLHGGVRRPGGDGGPGAA